MTALESLAFFRLCRVWHCKLLLPHCSVVYNSSWQLSEVLKLILDVLQARQCRHSPSLSTCKASASVWGLRLESLDFTATRSASKTLEKSWSRKSAPSNFEKHRRTARRQQMLFRYKVQTQTSATLRSLPACRPCQYTSIRQLT